MAKNTNLHRAKSAKNDEHYTLYRDIENELKHYKNHFKGKTVICNCDDPRCSNFFKYFTVNFEWLELKRVIATCYKSQDADLFSKQDSEKAIWVEYTGDKNGNRYPDPEEMTIHEFTGDGDFRSEECIELLKQADIVVTNPPFSLLREFVSLLMEHEKKFLIIGNKNAITYKEIFPLLKEGKIWLGCVPIVKQFMVPKGLDRKNTFTKDGKLYAEFGNIGWYTNLTHKKRNEELILFRKYNPKDYPKYDNYDAIEVSKVVDIPCDYAGVMGVPITFMDKYNPEQFKILGLAQGSKDKNILGIDFIGEKDARPLIGGKNKYARIFIRNKNPKPPEE